MGAPTLGKLGTRGTSGGQVVTAGCKTIGTGVQHGLLYTDINTTHNACSDDRRHAQNMVNWSHGGHKIR